MKQTGNRKLNRKRLKSLVIILAAIIIFVTSYSLILPAITMEVSVAQEEAGIVLHEQEDDLCVSETDREEACEASETQAADAAEPDMPKTDEDLSSDAGASDSETAAAEETTGVDNDTATTAETNKEAADAQTEAEAADAAGLSADEEKQEMPALTFTAEIKKGKTRAKAAGLTDSEQQAAEKKANDTEAAANPETGKKKILAKVVAEAKADTFPAGTTMEIEEVSADEAVLDAIAAVFADEVKQVQAVDITFYDNNGKKIEPAQEIKVTITSEAIKQAEDPVIVHIPDRGDAELVECIDEKKLEEKPAEDEVIFEADQFSVYAIVSNNDVKIPDYGSAATEIEEYVGYYISNTLASNPPRYLTNKLYTDQSPNGLRKTTVTSDAALFYFEKADEDNKWYVYTYDDSGSKRYIYFKYYTNNLADLLLSAADTKPANAMKIEYTANKGFSVEGYDVDTNGTEKTWYLNQNSGVNGERFAGYNIRGNDSNSYVTIVKPEAQAEDTLGLGGKTYGILWNNDTVSGTALMATAGTLNNQKVTHTDKDGNNLKDKNGNTITTQENINVLKGQTAIVRVDPVSRSDLRFVANNVDITMWTFVSCGPLQYYITTEVNGELKYLHFDDVASAEYGNSNNKGVSLVSKADERCKITVTPGTGSNSGKYKFTSCGRTLYRDGTNFYTKESKEEGAGAYMYFAEKSNLNDDDFVIYTAEKVSISGTEDENGDMNYDVKNGDQVIIYTRIWNEETLKYEYYAIDSDGELVKAYQSGDTISWVGSKVNTMLWNFTEYYYDDGTPNYYYDLQNAYSGKYIAPQVSGEGFLSDKAIGVNLNGRRNGEYYTTVLAWDDPYYDYASLKAQNYQLTSAPIAKADTFYFAKMKPEETENKLTTVATVDHTQYGITVKMQDYDNPLNGRNRDSLQWAVMGDLNANNGIDYSNERGGKGLLTKNIDGSYPKAVKTGCSLSELFSETSEVNQLFLASTYQETGYFEYDCTQNFAHLITSTEDKWCGQDRPGGGVYGVGDFVVYQQLGTTTQGGEDQRHGNFFPYNDLTEGYFATNVSNTGALDRTSLSSLDARYGEKLYAIKHGINDRTKWNGKIDQADYYFGMEMSASFMQTANGLDDWGHDLIFEFSGDDDFWLYIDDMLVLDLGGVHYAMSGSVNFRTGDVWCQTHYRDAYGKKEAMTTLRALYEAAYREKHAGDNEALTDAAVTAWLDGIFKEGTSVFKDFSAHTVRMFYMERDAGASNLHMRFNLTPYTTGQVQLEKQVSGTEAIDESMSFPFQIRVKGTDGAEHLVVQKTDDSSVDSPYDYSVKDAQTGASIPYQETYTVDGLEYKNVFFLHPGQAALIDFLDENTEYAITECGLDTAVFDSVKINENRVTGTVTQATGRQDFTAEEASVSARKKVIYDNHVSPNAQHSLTVTKKLWQEYTKKNEITATEDQTNFRFRIYIGKDGENYKVYNTGKYYVKDAEGNYCIYRNGKFESTGKKIFSELSGEEVQGQWKSEKEQATFHTSPGGAADKIPAGYSIEIPDLMEGTAFLVEERDDEIPAGYNRIDYVRVGSTESESPNAGVIHKSDETVIVNNQHGYGLVVDKEWSDAPFMDSHDPIYFAVYVKNGEKLTLLRDTVRRLPGTVTTLQWFFPELQDNKNLNDYQVYEVKLPAGYSIANDGTETMPVGYTPDKDGMTVHLTDGADEPTRLKENDTLTVGGVTNEHGYSDKYDYTVNYTRETLSEEQLQDQKINSRTDTVSNARPGIKLVKTDMSGNPLSGAKFTLVKKKDSTSKKTFTSDEKGLIAVAYLTTGEEYTLTEVSAPYQYLALVDSLTIKVEDGELYVNEKVTSGENDCYTVTQEANPTAEQMPTVSIKNRAFTLQAVKQDAVSRSPISNVTFALYREVKEYYTEKPMPDYKPMEGFESLVTGENGIIPKINLTDLSAGTYYLREVNRPTTYQMPDYDIRLTIAQTGQISIQKAVSSYDATTKAYSWTFSALAEDEAVVDTAENGNVTLAVKNTPAKGVQILKVGDGNVNNVLEGAEFALYRLAQLNDEKTQPKEGEQPIRTGTTDQSGILNLGVLDSNMEYYLFETKAPAGYNMLTAPVHITSMSGGRISAFLDAALKVTTVREGNAEIYRIQISNASGYELPSTGGPGTLAFTILGSILVAGAGVLLWRRRSRS